jgi:tetratricopeptide (TPR) repeat protein
VTGFGEVLRDLVAERQALSRVRKKDLAAAAGFSSSMFSHLLHGRRQAGSRDGVLSIARALDLGPDDADRLLVAAGFAPLTPRDWQVQFRAAERLEMQAVADARRLLKPPEREVLTDLMVQDIGLFGDALTAFTHARRALYQRDWPNARRLADDGLKEYYWPLRLVAVRFLAHQLLVKATAEHHIGELQEASRTAKRALEAAAVAKDPISECLGHARLGDVQRARGDLEAARQSYDAALTVLRTWSAKVAFQRRWVEHWTARIRSKRATLFLLQGDAQRALPELEASLGTFSVHDHGYERARVLNSMAWAYSLLGLWDRAEECADAVLALSDTIEVEHHDPKARLQAYLGLAGVALNMSNHRKALAALQRARTIVQEAERYEWAGVRFHEIGRLYLLLGTFYSAQSRFQDLLQAEEFFERALRLYEAATWRDATRLASVHIHYGHYHLLAGDPLSAYRHYSSALALSRETKPVNRYYQASALVERCHASLKLEEDRHQFEEEAAEASHACQIREGTTVSVPAELSRLRARLEMAWTRAAWQWEDDTAARRHLLEALRQAERFNRFVLREVWQDLAHGAATLPADRSASAMADLWNYLLSLPDPEGMIDTHRDDPPLYDHHSLPRLIAAVDRELILLLSGHELLYAHESDIAHKVTALHRSGIVPARLTRTLDEFRAIYQNSYQIDHTSPRTILMVLQTGLSVIKLLRRLPRQTHIARYVGIPLYSSPAPTTVLSGVQAVIIESRRPEATDGLLRGLPTKRTELLAGQEVLWKLSEDADVEAAWYEEPGTREFTPIWSGGKLFGGEMVSALDCPHHAARVWTREIGGFRPSGDRPSS